MTLQDLRNGDVVLVNETWDWEKYRVRIIDGEPFYKKYSSFRKLDGNVWRFVRHGFLQSLIKRIKF